MNPEDIWFRQQLCRKRHDEVWSVQLLRVSEVGNGAEEICCDSKSSSKFIRDDYSPWTKTAEPQRIGTTEVNSVPDSHRVSPANHPGVCKRSGEGKQLVRSVGKSEEVHSVLA